MKSGVELEPIRSVEGWIIIVTGLHEDTYEEELIDRFSEYGRVTACHMNIDRATGFTKGYAFLEYENESEAREAICRGAEWPLLDQTIKVDWAFMRPVKPRISPDDRKNLGRRSRSNSPERNDVNAE